MGATTDDKLSRLYGERRDALKRFLIARLGSAEEAEDAVQEIFLKLHKGNLADKIENTGAFLFKMAANVAVDRVRQRQRAHRRPWVCRHKKTAP